MSLINISTDFVIESAEGIICRATVESNDGKKATMLGKGATLEVASQAAISNSKIQLAMLVCETQSQSIHNPGQESKKIQYNNNHTNDKTRFNGGGNKPASDKQIDWIENSARKKGSTGDNFAQEKFGKYLHNLSGAEAHQLIGELKYTKPF